MALMVAEQRLQIFHAQLTVAAGGAAALIGLLELIREQRSPLEPGYGLNDFRVLAVEVSEIFVQVMVCVQKPPGPQGVEVAFVAALSRF